MGACASRRTKTVAKRKENSALGLRSWMDDLNSSFMCTVCHVLNPGGFIVIWESTEKTPTAVTPFWTVSGKRVTRGAFQFSLHGLRWCCCAKCWSCVKLQCCSMGTELYGEESLGPGWLYVDFLVKEWLDFAWGSGVQTEPVVNRTAEAVIWFDFCYNVGIFSSRFQA